MTEHIQDATGGSYFVSDFTSPSMGHFVCVSFSHPGRRTGGDLTNEQAVRLAEEILRKATNG